jgi:hypothetical protein
VRGDATASRAARCRLGKEEKIPVRRAGLNSDWKKLGQLRARISRARRARENI